MTMSNVKFTTYQSKVRQFFTHLTAGNVEESLIHGWAPQLFKDLLCLYDMGIVGTTMSKEQNPPKTIKGARPSLLSGKPFAKQ